MTFSLLDQLTRCSCLLRSIFEVRRYEVQLEVSVSMQFILLKLFQNHTPYREKNILFCEFNLEYSTKKLPLDDDRVLYRNGYWLGQKIC